MKKKYTFLSILILFIVASTSAIFFQLSAENEPLEGYELYLDRNKRLCEQYKPQKPLYTSKEFKNPGEENEYNNFGTGGADIGGNDLEIAKGKYKETMNSIYRCALLNAQERSINFINDTLDQNSKITSFTQEYEAKLKRLRKERDNSNCVNANNSSKQGDKVNVLSQATYELCKYNNYLEYLYEYNSVIANVIAEDKKSSSGSLLSPDSISETYNLTEIANLETIKKQKIKAEIERAYRIYPIVFQAYTEYENNLPIHDLLTMLRNDFLEFKTDLHKNLNPINQVVYKISNAMKE